MSIDAVFERIADDLGIRKGMLENTLSWKFRITYSVAAKRGLDSLWEEEDDDGQNSPVSLHRITRTIKQVFKAFHAFCPELEMDMDNFMQRYLRDNESPEVALVEILQKGGCFYHCPYRAAPAAPSQAGIAGVSFLRGLSPGSQRSMSGSGMFTEAHTNTHFEDIMNMFGLRRILSHTGLDNLETALPEQYREHMDGWEFLDLSWKNGKYWKGKPDKGVSSLARKQQEAKKTYALYRYDGREFSSRALPEHWHSGTHYLTLAVALLSRRGALPSILVKDDGPLIHLRLGYKLPPSEETFFFLYSWPDIVRKSNPSFSRMMSRPVFEAFQILMNHLGYTFLEEAHG